MRLAERHPQIYPHEYMQYVWGGGDILRLKRDIQAKFSELISFKDQWHGLGCPLQLHTPNSQRVHVH